MSRRGCGRKLLASFLLLVVITVPAAAQEGLGNEQALKRDFSGENLSKFNKLLEGEVKYTPADKAISEMAARSFVYKFTWRDTYRTKGVSPQQLIKAFENRMDKAGQSTGNQAFMDQFAKDLAVCFREAMALPLVDNNRVYCVNVALLLPGLGKCKNEEAADFLAEVVADPKTHSMYRMNAVKGLREFFPVLRVKGDEDMDNAFQLKKSRAAKRVDAVIAYIHQDWNVSENAPKEEVDAVHFQRREGVRTLALAQTPAVEIVKNAKVSGSAAVGLMQVLYKSGQTLAPKAGTAERVEAAIGVGKLRTNGIDSYNSPLAVSLVAQLVLDFADDYVKDFPAVSSKKLIPLLPWKVYANRLEEALTDFQKYVPKEVEPQQKAQKQLKDLKDLTEPLFRNIRASQSIDPQGLRAFVDGLPPIANPLVFEGVATTSLKGGKGN